jgi:hypothetical protein
MFYYLLLFMQFMQFFVHLSVVSEIVEIRMVIVLDKYVKNKINRYISIQKSVKVDLV